MQYNKLKFYQLFTCISLFPVVPNYVHFRLFANLDALLLLKLIKWTIDDIILSSTATIFIDCKSGSRYARLYYDSLQNNCISYFMV